MNIEIHKYLRLIKRWWWLLVVSTVIPMAISYYFTSQQLDLYQANVKIMVGTSLFQNPDPDPWQLSLSNTLANAYAEMVKQGPVTEAVIERLGLDRTPEKLSSQITTWVHSGAQLLEIQVTDTNPEAAALIANALADELVRRSPASGKSDPEQQQFVRIQLETLQAKIAKTDEQIDDLTSSLSELTSAAEIQESQDRIAALDEVRALYQSTYANLLEVYRAESPNVLSLFDPAVVPQWPVPSQTKLIVAITGAAGLGLALSAIFLMEYMDTSLRWEDDGEQSILELPVLGAIPQVSKKGTSLSSNPLSPVADGIHTMQANIFLMRPDHPFGTLVLTSPGDSEGKSFVLANLAISLASAGNRVIAVDADMRKPSLHEFFDQPNVAGMADILSDCKDDTENSLSVPLQETNFDNLYLLSAGQPAVDPTTLLISPRLPALLEFLRGRGDAILIDSPPVLGSPDATVLATLSDDAILVISAGSTKRAMLQQAKDRLGTQQGVNLLGLTVNRVKLNGKSSYHNPDRGSKKARKKKKKKNGDSARLTLSDAAERLGISKAIARRWCKTGRLPATRKGLWWQVDQDGLKRIIEDTLEIKTQA
jgi:succinoglycan biosynthesis transport protein ExoP